jgi:16S rRNA (adenine1518-N6/adenine1519-N6)-dimethyltransferase
MSLHQPRKRFGQHFLHDRNVIDRIISAIRPQPGQIMIEIGPGLGALTLPLLERIGELHVIELDRDLAKKIAGQCKNTGTLHLHNTDALEFDFCGISRQRIRVTGNLPYNISTPLVFHLLDQLDCISDMVFMLQEEVVDRMSAGPGTRIYGRLSVMVQARCRVEKLFHVRPGAFNPPPKVESAIVKLTPHEKPVANIHNHAAFAMIVRDAFNQRRKTLRNALGNYLDAGQIESLGIDAGLRPEQLAVEQFAALANLYQDLQNQ